MSGVEDTSEFIFELYGPGGTAYVVLMEGSKKATCRLDLNGLVKKELAKVASEGSVLFGFDKVG